MFLRLLNLILIFNHYQNQPIHHIKKLLINYKVFFINKVELDYLQVFFVIN